MRDLQVEIHAISHATEDVEKVIIAIRNLLPSDYSSSMSFVKERLKGHYGNPITLIKSKIDDELRARMFVENLFKRIDYEDKAYLSSNLESHVDESGTLYLRFDKQLAFLGKVKLGYEDPIRVLMKFGRGALEEARLLLPAPHSQ